MSLSNQRINMLQRWEERWEHLQLILEVYQFARDASVAEHWLFAQEPYLMSQELGCSIDEVENLIKKHEAFDKACSAQEERFAALERLTTYELKELKRKQEEEEKERLRQEELAKQAAAPAPSQSPEQSKDGIDGADDSHVNGEEHDESREEHEESAAAKGGGSAPSTPRPSSTPVTPAPASGSVRGRPGSSATLPPQSPSTPTSSPPTPASKESRRRVRSRSKSPFRSFRWKKPKSPSEAPGSASDDESNLERAAERPSPSGDEDQLEGSLYRKHEWENTTKKASNRSWDKLFLVLRGNMLLFYKDRKSYQAAPEVYFRAEPPLDVSGGQASVADDYTKKKHVLRLKLIGGAEYLFQAKDDEELSFWVGALQAAVSTEGSAGPSRSQTLPAGAEKKDEPKRRSFFTLKKK